MTALPLTLAAVIVALTIAGLLVTVLAFRRALHATQVRADEWQQMAENATSRARIKQGVLLSLTRERDEARAHLAKFTGPRERHPVTKRFVSAKKVVA